MSCAHLKKDLQVLMNKLKSVTEIINVLKEEMANKGATSHDPLPISVSEIHPKINAVNLTTN
jgi:hypothetical protein